MAKTTWDANRTGGGTYEFSHNAEGKYVLNSIGFQKFGKLNLPDLGKSDTKTTKKDTTTDTAKLSKQTSEAFGDVKPFYYDQTGKGDQYTSQYEMQKGGDLATDQARAKGDTFAQARQAMTSDAAYRGVTPSSRQPGFEVSDTLERGTPISAVDKARKDAGSFISKVNDPKSMDYGMQLSSAQPTKQAEYSTTRPSGIDAPTVSPTTYRSQTQKFKERFDPTKIQAAPQKVSPLKKATQVTQTALKKVNTGLKPLAKAIGFVMNPVGSVLGMVAGSFKETDQHKHDEAYFSKTNGILENGRIAGNPTTSVFAGLNSKSAFGNLSKTAMSRVSKRNSKKTQANLDALNDPARKAAFNAKTKAMQKEVMDHNKSVAKDRTLDAPPSIKQGTGGNGGGGGGRVICTYFYSKNQFSLIDLQLDTEFSRNNLSDEVKIGYWFWAIPLVDWMKKHENSNNWWVKLVKNSTKLFAQERAKEIAYTMGKKNKGSLIGKFVRLFGETGCYILGTLIKPFVFDKYKGFLNEYQKDVNLIGKI